VVLLPDVDLFAFKASLSLLLAAKCLDVDGTASKTKPQNFYGSRPFWLRSCGGGNGKATLQADK
jgi:hypothetical protein